MAEHKKSFVLYADLIHTVRKMPKNKAGELFMTILSYVNDENPEVKDLMVDLAFEPIKQQLKRDLKEWETIRQKRSEAGKIGGARSVEKRRSKRKQREPNLTIASKNEANQAVNDTVTVNVTVTDNVIKEEIAPQKNNLHGSNLFRQPNAPQFADVHRHFLGAGGTEEMAKKFFDKWEGVGWYYQGSPIMKWASLANTFISNWKSNEHKNLNDGTQRDQRNNGKPKLGTSDAKTERIKTW